MISILTVSLTTQLQAQVTIGDGIPPQKFSILELSTLSTKGGIRLPQLTTSEKLGLSLEDLTDPNEIKMAKGLTVYDITDNSVEYWDGTTWEKLDIVGPWRISNANPGTDTIATENSQNIYQMGRVSVGTSNGDPSAALNIYAKNKGVLIPRVTLTGSTDRTTISNPAKGLLVYNTGENDKFAISGFLYWNGNSWMKFSDRATTPPSITSLLCDGAQLTPSTYTNNKDYSGILEVPYTGGNGASYDGGEQLGPIDGLYYKLQPGTLEYGNGKITYAITGRPTASSPIETSFPISFLSKSCTAKVGRGGASFETRTYLGPMYAVSGGAEYAVTTFDGRYSMRFFVNANQSLNLTDIQIKHNGTVYSDNDNIMILHSSDYNGGAFGDSDNACVVTQSWKTNGNPDVYFGGNPEYRQLVFTPIDNTKKIYRYSFFFGAPASAYSNYTKTKCWIYAEEIVSE
ncbi:MULTISPECIES: hypothetical protein [unclassified Dysgonomonas]|uniref:hypothetical protein n=1 Tax=unclassified Dysgonomonas TaxID=2630389 RepID=UPI0024746185|nr:MULTISPECIES: hypothetical protein [unclassified Dysgonomonas]